MQKPSIYRCCQDCFSFFVFYCLLAFLYCLFFFLHVSPIIIVFILKPINMCIKKYTKKKEFGRNKSEQSWMELVPRPRLVLHSNQISLHGSQRLQPPLVGQKTQSVRSLFFGRPVSCHRFVLCLWCLGQVRRLGGCGGVGGFFEPPSHHHRHRLPTKVVRPAKQQRVCPKVRPMLLLLLFMNKKFCGYGCGLWFNCFYGNTK